VFILLDAARPDRFSSFGYSQPTTPEIDALAERGVVFLNHFSEATSTRDSLPSLLYSRYFTKAVFPASRSVPLARPEDLFRTLDQESISIPGALSAAGLKTAMISAHTWIRDNSQLAREFDDFYDLSRLLEYPPRYATPRAEQVVDFAIDWIEEHIEEDFFLYIHLMDTHFPHFFEADAKQLYGGEVDSETRSHFAPYGRPIDRGRALEGSDRAYLDALVDGGLKYTDRHLGRLFDHLERRRTLDETMIVLTSDHGEHLLDVPHRWEHGGPWYDAVARVPLIVFFPPRLAPAQADFLSQNVDVAPTILGLLGAELPEDKRFDGVDLSRILEGKRQERDYVFQRSAIRSATHKLILQRPPDQILGGILSDADDSIGELYSLREDPLEISNMWPGEEGLAARLFEEYRRALGVHWCRYYSARSYTQPESSFAISAASLELFSPSVPMTDFKDLQQALVANSDDAWIQYKSFMKLALVATGKPGPLAFNFNLPDGRYHLSASLLGSAQLRLDGDQESRPMVSPLPSDLGTRRTIQETEETNVGEILIKNQTFSGVLMADSSPFNLHHFGFQPLVGEEVAEPTSEDEETLERLRVLGYVD
jgi:arylsulfatase A-like enzyme